MWLEVFLQNARMGIFILKKILINIVASGFVAPAIMRLQGSIAAKENKQAMVVALTGKDRARWSNKPDAAQVFDEWLASH